MGNAVRRHICAFFMLHLLTISQSAAATNLEADTIAIQLREFRNLSELTDSRRIAWTPDQSRDCLRNRFNIRYASNDTYQPENEPIEIPKTLSTNYISFAVHYTCP